VNLKKYLPKTLFLRSLMILVTPVVLIHLISGYVFFDKHWDKMNQLLAENVASQVASIVYFIKKQGFPEARSIALSYYNLEIKKSLDLPDYSQKISPFDQALSSKLAYPYRIQKTHQWISLWIKLEDGSICGIRLPSTRLMPRTPRLFVFWALGSSIVFLFIAAIVMRNQIRPLQRLVQWSKELEKENPSPLSKIEGAREIRKIALALQSIVARIRRTFNERNQMLAGISHDLKTPLARMKLSLQLMPPVQDVEDLKQDVDQMSAMVQSYLTFAQQVHEPFKTILLRPFLATLIEVYEFKGISLDAGKDLICTVQKTAFARCMQNLIDNAVRHAVSRVHISAAREKNKLILHIEDDGPGIAEALRESIFLPFFRSDPSRHLEGQHVGLGLSIVKNIVLHHAGSVQVTTSRWGGACFCLDLPQK
jgi:two-component system, OmpR family, osmolarity sensor histidine kinase EnvZ